jgi:hypothetical protein
MDKILQVSDSDLEIDAEPLGKLLSQHHRLERKETVEEATRAQEPAFDSSSITWRRNGVTPERGDESWVCYRYQEAPVSASWREKVPLMVRNTIATSNLMVVVYFGMRINIRQYR